MKNLSTPGVRQEIVARIQQLSLEDRAQWGRMTVQEMVCHLDDSYKAALGEKVVLPATGLLQQVVLKRLALRSPLPWAKGYPTRPEVEQGKGGTPPGVFTEDRTALLKTLDRFCDGLSSPPLPHPIFGAMTHGDWMRWGFLHADHHLRQFGR
jgi:hypothetical protein